jgi:hypothetical protein
MTDDGSVYYLFLAGKQDPRDSIREPAGGAGMSQGPRMTSPHRVVRADF